MFLSFLRYTSREASRLGSEEFQTEGKQTEETLAGLLWSSLPFSCVAAALSEDPQSFFYSAVAPVNDKTTTISKPEKLLLCGRRPLPDGDAASPRAQHSKHNRAVN